MTAKINDFFNLKAQLFCKNNLHHEIVDSESQFVKQQKI